MYDCWRRYSKHAWVAWLPLLFVGAMLFWTVALGLGGLSLVAVSALSGECHRSAAVGPGAAPTVTEPMPGSSASGYGIVVRLEESADPQDVDALRPGVPSIEADDAVEVLLEDAIEDVDDNAGAAPPAAVEYR
jgi:hypothetical protein